MLWFSIQSTFSWFDLISFTGSAHKFQPIDRLVKTVIVDVELLKAQLGEKEEKLAALFKTTSKIVTDYDGKTKRIIQTLHERRDEQVCLCVV